MTIKVLEMEMVNGEVRGHLALSDAGIIPFRVTRQEDTWRAVVLTIGDSPLVAGRGQSPLEALHNLATHLGWTWE